MGKQKTNSIVQDFEDVFYGLQHLYITEIRWEKIRAGLYFAHIDKACVNVEKLEKGWFWCITETYPNNDIIIAKGFCNKMNEAKVISLFNAAVYGLL